MSGKPSSRSTTRREIVKARFVAPAIITLRLASAGSPDHEPREQKHDPRRTDD